MSKAKRLYLLQNQDKYFLGKNNEWVDGTDLKELFKTPHRDIAVNQLFEVNAQDYTQRIQVLDCTVAGNNQPVIPAEVMPPPLPKKPTPAADTDNQADVPVAIDAETTGEQSEWEPAASAEPGQELLVHEF